jgi:1-phosphatidylinositol-4-phosphate 5-kinase
LWFSLNDVEHARRERQRKIDHSKLPLMKRSSRRLDEANQLDRKVSPQFNTALRGEVLFYTTSGICRSTKLQDDLDQSQLETVFDDGSLYDPVVRHLYIQPPSAGLGYDPTVPPIPSPDGKSGSTDFTVYRPHLFANVRKLYGITGDNFFDSFAERTAKLSLSDGGSSGAFMFFSGDMQYIVKSMSTCERKFLVSIADRYFAFLRKHPNSFITRFFGCYSIKLYSSTYSFVVMGNNFAQNAKSRDEVIYRTYDLKGSWVNRSGKVSMAELFQMNAVKAVLKDNDLQQKLQLQPEEAESIYNSLMDDTSFLCSLGIMDYSLLLGVVYKAPTSFLPSVLPLLLSFLHFLPSFPPSFLQLPCFLPSFLSSLHLFPFFRPSFLHFLPSFRPSFLHFLPQGVSGRRQQRNGCQGSAE